MVETLDYAPPERKSTNRRWIGWTACVISILISLCVGVGSLKSAYEFRQSVTTGVIAAGRTSEDLVIERLLNNVVPPVLFCLTLIGCAMCWRRKTGAWLALTALLIGVACWAASLCIYH